MHMKLAPKKVTLVLVRYVCPLIIPKQWKNQLRRLNEGDCDCHHESFLFLEKFHLCKDGYLWDWLQRETNLNPLVRLSKYMPYSLRIRFKNAISKFWKFYAFLKKNTRSISIFPMPNSMIMIISITWKATPDSGSTLRKVVWSSLEGLSPLIVLLLLSSDAPDRKCGADPYAGAPWTTAKCSQRTWWWTHHLHTWQPSVEKSPSLQVSGWLGGWQLERSHESSNVFSLAHFAAWVQSTCSRCDDIGHNFVPMDPNHFTFLLLQ